MEGLPNVAEAIRRMTEAYTSALAIMTKTLESLPKEDGEAARRAAEQWLRLARLGKDGFVTALDQAFELWERECRRVVAGAPGAAPSAPPQSPPQNPMEAWAESWRKMLEGLGPGTMGSEAWSKQVQQQAELVQQTMQEGLRAWQRLWQPPQRKP